MEQNRAYKKWMFILLPALAMSLGWGLRGHIGGGPYGAMIPGAMVALSICLLLELPRTFSALVVVFGVAGVGIGGEMTYGQTLGFLRNMDTVWWGTFGTTVKGATWGFLGGMILSLGFLHRQIPLKTLLYAYLWLFVGMVIGFKLINDPMVLYFSYPEKPRPESWAALLVGGIAMFIYLRFKLPTVSRQLVTRFSLWGLLGGGLGFGLGGFWFVIGGKLGDTVVYHDWWKAMEFSFGALLGAALGFAAWLSRTMIQELAQEKSTFENQHGRVYQELLIGLGAGLLIYWLVPYTLEPFADGASSTDSFVMVGLRTIATILVNYAFFGLILILIALKFPWAAWQLGITLTFCHAAIDLIRDFYPDTNMWTPFTMYFLFVFLLTANVGLLVSYYKQNERLVRNLLLLLIWACMLISFGRWALHPERLNIDGLSFMQVVFGRFAVDLIFFSEAVVLTVLLKRWFGDAKLERSKVASYS
ncbi:hypothetical protein [Sunxiuqinia rutila]|uniref:hypothetical protein n=1 Tax=Sunxiuqinia rutila TaxID=1397841 RepID=UPI003D35EF77